jgi:ABC-2 type transport system ATP-binding protein
MSTHIIELKHVSYSYGRIDAVKNVSIQIPPGVLGLLGPNGAGKTTLMKILLGFLTPSSGQGTVLSYSLRHDHRAIRQHIGYMPESDCMIPHTDAVSLTAYMGALAGMPWQEAVKRAHEVLYYVGLDDARYRQVNTYSTGMKQKLKLATALVHDPKLLFLDEPTSGMDPSARGEMLSLIRDIAKKGQMNIILSSHILADIETTCQKVYIMNRGEMVAEKSVGQEKSLLAACYRVKLNGQLDLLPESIRKHLTPAEHPGSFFLKLSAPMDKQSFFTALAKGNVQLREFLPETETLATTFEAAIGENHEH